MQMGPLHGNCACQGNDLKVDLIFTGNFPSRLADTKFCETADPAQRAARLNVFLTGKGLNGGKQVLRRF